MKMTDCYFEKKDWRLCKSEVRSLVSLAMVFDLNVTCGNNISSSTAGREIFANDILQMERFKTCWKLHQNDKRTDQKEA